MDSVFSLLCFCILSNCSNRLCQFWRESSFARILFPDARLSSQRISDILALLSEEYPCRELFKFYLKLFKEDLEGDGTNVLIDSTGLPDSIHFPLTAISNHNGEIENEVRRIYVTQQETGLPVCFRYCPGIVIDVSTLSRTMRELKKAGVNTKLAILDA